MDLEQMELIDSRYELATERLCEINTEELEDKNFQAYFRFVAAFLLYMDETYKWAASDRINTDSLEEMQKRNKELYADILPDNYDKSYANPVYAVAQLGEEYGRLLSSVYYEMRSLISNAFEGQKYEMLIRMELFLEIYGAFKSSSDDRKSLPKYEDIRQIYYWFFSDYAEEERQLRFSQMVNPVEDYARDIVMNSDLTDLRYLYRYGEYVSENELETARHLNSMTEEEINKMADTFTEGYRIGFEMTGKDITIKKTANIRYFLGFERMIRKAVLNFENINLKSSLYRALPSIFFVANSTSRNGYTGAVANHQYDYDHKDDDGLVLDGALITRKLEAIRSAGEKYKKEAKLFGGPAVLEVFGEKPFSPEVKKEAIHLSESQTKALSEYKIQASLITNEYIIGEERSFTIIAFPIPEIGDDYEKIFDETVRINTLDYKLYQGIQQKLIDALDKAEYCVVKGMGDNHTDMRVVLHELRNPEKETNFENCVADVNIPVGEVFTSPILTGTNGVLHVTGVYLDGLLYKNLEIKFKDGCISEYTCSNFDNEEDNKKYISENILFGHKTLPLGEFAIGTNTTAYVVARKYNISDKLPILIAEKTGPHFAVGDTCYSHEEDIITYNPDGKSIIARDNEIAALRKTDPNKAYFSCHTDITIPYNELGELSAVTKTGEVITIISNGRFVLPGTEQLNEPLDTL